MKFKERRANQQAATFDRKSIRQQAGEPVSKRTPQASETACASVTSKPQGQTKPIVIPPLPEGYMGARIAAHELASYQKGEAVCAYICKPDEIVGRHYWIWYDFKTGQPQCETTPPTSDRYIPEDFKRQMTATQATSNNLTQGAGITLSSPSIGSTPIEDEGFTNGASLPDDFKLWLSRHPGMTIEEALHRYCEEQKTSNASKGQNCTNQ